MHTLRVACVAYDFLHTLRVAHVACDFSTRCAWHALRVTRLLGASGNGCDAQKVLRFHALRVTDYTNALRVTCSVATVWVRV